MKSIKHNFKKYSFFIRLLAIVGIFTMQFQEIVAQQCPVVDGCPNNCTSNDIQDADYFITDLDGNLISSCGTPGEILDVVVNISFYINATNRYDLVVFGNAISPTFCENYEICLGDYENVPQPVIEPICTTQWVCGEPLEIVNAFFSWKVPDTDPDDCSRCPAQNSKCQRESAMQAVGTPLPIELMNFNVQKINSSAKIKWVTLTEINNDYFELEHSAEGKEFYTIGKVIGAGTSNDKNEYSFVDESPISGINYYRLKQVDYDGKNSYSRVRSLFFDEGQSQISVYPNPVRGNLSLISEKNNGKVTLNILDINGHIVYTQVFKPGTWNSLMKIDISSLSEGMYLIDVLGDTKIETTRFMKSK